MCISVSICRKKKKKVKMLPNQKVELRKHKRRKKNRNNFFKSRQVILWCVIQKSDVKVKLTVEELMCRRILKCLNTKHPNPAPSDMDL